MDKPHKKLNAWKLAMDIAEKIYSTTDSFPSSEKFGLVSQMRRCAISIPSNIAEGASRNTKIEEDKIISGLIRSQKRAD